jgi:GNAT superfamily N-acetyltransferase
MVPKPHAAAQVVPLDPAHLPEVRDLINAHLDLMVPGWALTEPFIASHLQRNSGQAITDPWVIERATLCALEGQRLVAAAHLLRYGRGPQVGPAYAGTGEIAWFLAWVDAGEAAAALLDAAHAQMHAWGITPDYAWGTGLPVSPFVGVPDVWPHIAAALTRAGYRPGVGNEEAVYGGALDAGPPPADPPIQGLALQRRLIATLWAANEMRFAALLDGREIGKCEVALDLADGGALPALQQWAQLTELDVEGPWRNQDIGAWLVRQAVAWIRLGGRSRLVVATMADNAGAIRFYRRFGWELLVHEQKGWKRAASPAPQLLAKSGRCRAGSDRCLPDFTAAPSPRGRSAGSPGLLPPPAGRRWRVDCSWRASSNPGRSVARG